MYRRSVPVVAPTSLLVFVIVALSTGCGSDHKNVGQDQAQPQYQVSLTNSINEDSIHGQISVDTAGLVSTQLTGATASTTYTLNFCPAPAQTYSCFRVSDVMTDGSGNAATTMTFPASGDWAGDFHLDTGGSTQFKTDVSPALSASQVFFATLQASSTTNGQGIFMNGSPGPQDPLNSGTVSWSNGMLLVDIKGAAANITYGTGQCPINFGSNCYLLYDKAGTSGFTTDANGNVSYSVMPDGVPGDIFEVDPPTGRAGFVAGFKVP